MKILAVAAAAMFVATVIVPTTVADARPGRGWKTKTVCKKWHDRRGWHRKCWQQRTRGRW